MCTLYINIFIYSTSKFKIACFCGVSSVYLIEETSNSKLIDTTRVATHWHCATNSVFIYFFGSTVKTKRGDSRGFFSASVK